MLQELARIALAENCYGMKWQVLDWNTPAIEFYEKLGANLQKEWLSVRIMGEPLKALAEAAGEGTVAHD